MEKLLCNKCTNEIQRGVGGYKEGDTPIFYRMQVIKYSSLGQHLETKEYDLCEKCHDEFIGFLSYKKDNPNSHVDTDNNGTNYANSTNKDCNQYAIRLREDEKEDKTFLIGKNMNTKDAISNVIKIGHGLKGIKSILKCGNTYWYSTKVFNKFQKKMWKLFFGIEIEEKKELYKTLKGE